MNGCSLKTKENLAAVAAIPEARLLIETDSPWCGVRPTHASARFSGAPPTARDKKKHNPALQVKGRNEPCNLPQVLAAVAGVRRGPAASWLLGLGSSCLFACSGSAELHHVARACVR